MTGIAVSLVALLILPVLLDRLVTPQPTALPAGRSAIGTTISLLAVLAAFGLFLAICGSVPAAAAFSVALVALLMLVSNAKRRVMAEPLLFSDFAMLASVFRHPQFYLAALTPVQIVLIALLLIGIVPLLAMVFVAAPIPHLVGLVVLGAATLLRRAVVKRALQRGLATQACAQSDVLRHGLIATLILHRQRWLASGDPIRQPLLPAVAAEPMLVMIVQCESFACPVEVFGDPALALPGLAAAQASAWQHGRLLVSGFGANTMRTEYGVIFGREESDLGFRRFDPYLTALGDAAYALPARLNGAGFRSQFVHPHDMRFYNRHRIMPAAGFDTLVGMEYFAPPGPGEGRYVTDAAMTDRLLALARAATGAELLYAVTIENHGPWSAAQGACPVPPYLPLVRNSDAMLSALSDGLRTLGRPAMLVFFGDHRPSIPGLCEPGSERHTPYVVLRFDGNGCTISGTGRPRDLTPAQLHHIILELIGTRLPVAAPQAAQAAQAA